MSDKAVLVYAREGRDTRVELMIVSPGSPREIVHPMTDDAAQFLAAQILHYLTNRKRS